MSILWNRDYTSDFLSLFDADCKSILHLPDFIDVDIRYINTVSNFKTKMSGFETSTFINKYMYWV